MRGRKVTAGMLAGIIVSAKLSLLTTYAPIVAAAPPVRAAWLATLIAGAAALPVVLAATLLADRFGHTPLPQAARQVLGRAGGWTVTASAAVLFMYLAATTTRSLVTFVAITALRRTPIWMLCALFLLPVARGAHAGLYGVGRLSRLTAGATVVAVLVLMALLYNHMDLRRLQPVLEGGIVPVLHQAATPVGALAEGAWIVMLAYPFVENPRLLRRGALVGLAVNVATVGLGAAMLVSVFGPGLLSRLMFPTYSAAEVVQQGSFLQRIEWMMVLTWIGTVYVKVSVLLYGASRFTASALGLRDGPVAVLAVAAAVFAASLYVYHSALGVWLGYSPPRFLPPELALEVVIPGVVLLAASLRRRGRPAVGDAP